MQKVKNFKLVLLSFVLIQSLASFSQNAEDLYSKGIQYKKDLNYKDGFFVFQKLLSLDSSNADYLCNASYFYSRYGKTLTESVQMSYYYKAEYLAIKAIGANKLNPECHYVYALALARINENASTKQKIANSKKIKNELDLTIKGNPKHAGAYHILGRWHRTIAGFSYLEKLAINALFGGVPEGGSYNDAVKCFLQAIINEPKYKLHQYELALTYYEMGKKEDAKVWLKKALAIPDLYKDDALANQKCNDLLKKIE